MEWSTCEDCGVTVRSLSEHECKKVDLLFLLDNAREDIIRLREKLEKRKGLNECSAECFKANEKWHHDLVTGKRLDRNKGELFMLMVSEISEAMEGERKNLMDDKLPHRRMVEVELADLLIRVFDYAGEFGLDLEGAYSEKMKYNAHREDHTRESRLKENGKKW